MERLHRVRWLWFSFAALVLLGAGVAAWRFFTVIRPTPFALELAATSISFTSPGDPAAVKDANGQTPAILPLGLLAGSRTLVNLEIKGCDAIQPESGGPQRPCPAMNLHVDGVQLSHLTLAPGTKVWLNIIHGALSLQMEQGGNGASVVSFAWPAGQKSAGEWRIVPAGNVLTILLSDAPGEPFALGPEENHPIEDGSAVRLDPDLGEHAETNLLHLPDLPKEFASTQVGEGPVRVKRLANGELRHLSLVRKDGQMASLRATLTGSSPEIMVYDRYEDAPRNQALTGFDANSGKDRKLRMIAIFFLVTGGLGMLSTLLGVTLHGLELLETVRSWREVHDSEGQRAPHKSEIEDPEFELPEKEPPAAADEAASARESATVVPTDV